MSENIKVFELLAELNYPLKRLYYNIRANNCIEVRFMNDNDYINFKNISKQKINLNMNTITFYPDFIRIYIYESDFIKIPFPSQVNTIIIENYSSIENPINLNNLPHNLQKLSVNSFKPINIDNLPIGLEELEINKHKTNLDNLPINLKVLKLNYEMDNFDMNYESDYEIYDFANLPISLNEIYIRFKKFNSIDELINNYIP